jgi:hypothetical protein
MGLPFNIFGDGEWDSRGVSLSSSKNDRLWGTTLMEALTEEASIETGSLDAGVRQRAS